MGRNLIAGTLLIGSLFLSGCNPYPDYYDTLKKKIMTFTEKAIDLQTETWVDYSNNNLEVYQLLKKGEYEKAQKILEVQFYEDIKEAPKFKDCLKKQENRFSKTFIERTNNTIDNQIEKVERALKE